MMKNTPNSPTNEPAAAEKTVFGLHYIMELGDCDAEILKYVPAIKEILQDAAQRSKATVLHEHYHQFEPFGVSGFVLIAESHFSIHTWPENGYASVDIQTCGDTMDAQMAVRIIRDGLCAGKVHCRTVERGL